MESRHGQEQEMNTQENDFYSSDFTHQSLSAQINRATEPILRQVEKLCPLVTEGKELDTAGNSGATSSRRDDAPASSTDSCYDIP